MIYGLSQKSSLLHEARLVKQIAIVPQLSKCLKFEEVRGD